MKHLDRSLKGGEERARTLIQTHCVQEKLAGLVLDSGIVAQFVIEREIVGAGTLSEGQIREMSLRSIQALKDIGPQIQWLHSYVTEDKVYCVYLAPDEDDIREHARKAGLPADRISAVRRLIGPDPS